MADTSDIAAALIAKLGSDLELLALCPNGVYRDQAPPGATRFVIVSLMAGEDLGVFRHRAIEAGVYLVEARMLSTVPGANVKAAAARIDVAARGSAAHGRRLYLDDAAPGRADRADGSRRESIRRSGGSGAAGAIG